MMCLPEENIRKRTKGVMIMKKMLVFLVCCAMALFAVGTAPAELIPVPAEWISSGDYYYVIREDETAAIVSIKSLSNTSSSETLEFPTELDGVPVTKLGSLGLKGRAREVIIPEGVTTLADYTFYLWSNLESISLPSTLTEVGDGILYLTKCSGIHIAEGNSALEATGGMLISRKDRKLIYANASLEGSVAVPDGIQTIGAYAFGSCHKITEIKLPETLTAIRDYAFSGCFGIRKPMVIPSGVSEFGDGVFFNAMKVLKQDGNGKQYYDSIPLVLEEGNQFLSMADKALIDNLNHRLVYLNDEARREPYTIPDGIEEIAACAFWACNELEGVIIPETVTKIDQEAFECCYKLTEINFPSALQEIGDAAFTACVRLKSVTIPDSVTTIGIKAFSECSSLESVYIGAGVKSIGGNCFMSDPALTEIKMPAGLQPEKDILDTGSHTKITRY